MESLSPPLHNSRARALFLPIHERVFVLLFILFALRIVTVDAFTDPFSQIPYTLYCNDVVSQPNLSDNRLPNDGILSLRHAHVSLVGDQVVGREKEFVLDHDSVSFETQAAFSTDKTDVLMIVGLLRFRGPRMNGGYFGNSSRRGLRLVHVRPPKFPVRQWRPAFRLGGFWSSTTGKLCMVGSGLGNSRLFDVILKLNYRNSSNIYTSLVNGSFESLSKKGDSDMYYFDPISILGVSMMKYEYTLIDEEFKKGVFSVYDRMENVSIGTSLVQPFCSILRSVGNFVLEYGNDCKDIICNPLGLNDENLPAYMSFNDIECLDSGKVRYVLAFTNQRSKMVEIPFDPNTMLVAEGEWNGKKKHLDIVACRIFNETNSKIMGSVGDCLVRISLWMPATWSLINRSAVVGKMWIHTGVNSTGLPSQITLRSTINRNVDLPGLNYEYSKSYNISKYCAKRLEVKGKQEKYPSLNSPDMSFQMVVKFQKKNVANGYSSPIFVGDRFYERFRRVVIPDKSAVQANNGHNLVNVSYGMSFESWDEFKLGNELPPIRYVEIFAEGAYNTDTGFLCMVGCRRLTGKNAKNNSIDCEILVNARYSPLRTKGRNTVKGTIESTRSKSDPLYFDHLEFYSNSMYATQAHDSIWRMDLEITMVLISNTLVCFFVVLQLFYVNKHPDVLPFISVVLLLVLTLAHMIPLLLNFEALFVSNNNRQNIFLGAGGWLEVNEVLVRVITMIAFLLLLRLLHLAYSSRATDESQKSLWVSDKRVLCLSLPLFIIGCLMAWLFHMLRKPYQWPVLKPRRLFHQPPSFWGDLKSSAGLVLDGFLLPQILFNLFLDAKVQALAPSFYMGTTVIRLLPHAYDLYRAHSSSWSFSYIYANPGMNYYSTAWDIFISCAGLLFALLIYLQQRIGGRCFLPSSCRGHSSMYEKVPAVAVSNEPIS